MLGKILIIVAVIAIIKFTWGYIIDFIEDIFEKYPKVRYCFIGLVLVLLTALISFFGASSTGSFIGLFLTNSLMVGIAAFVVWFLTSAKAANLRNKFGKLAILVGGGGYLLYTIVSNAISATSMEDFITSEIASLLTPVAIYFIFKFLNSGAFVALTTEHNCTNCLYYKNGECTLQNPSITGNECQSYVKKF